MDGKSPTARSPESAESAYSADSAPPSATPRSSTPPMPRGPGAISPGSHARGFGPVSPSPPPSPPAGPYAWDRPPPSSEYLPDSDSWQSTLHVVVPSLPSLPSLPYASGEGPFVPALADSTRDGEGSEDGRSERGALPAYSRY